jgi:hypothetical protein
MLAVSDSRFEAISTDYFSRVLRIQTNSSALVSGLPDVGPWNRLLAGGKSGGAHALLPSAVVGATTASGWKGSLWNALARFKGHTIVGPSNVEAFTSAVPVAVRLPFTAADDPARRAVRACTGAAACAHGACVDGACVCWRGWSGATCATAISGAGEKTPFSCLAANPASTVFGVGLSGLSYWSRQAVFTDVMKSSSSTWISQHFTDYTWSTGETLHTAGTDYPARLGPNQAVGVMMLRDLMENAEDGVYTVRWDGDGIVLCSLEAVAIVRPAAGVMLCTMNFTTQFNNGLFLRIQYTNPSDPVRNLRVFMPGFDEGNLAGPGADGVVAASAAGPWPAVPFHPHLLRFLEPFPVLRFMDWMDANSQLSGSAASRPTAARRAFTQPGGVPLEHLILLCNLVGSAPHFNLPVRLTDAYATQFATIVRDQLRADVDIYVELGNENWHTGFDGGIYAQAQGVLAGISRFCWSSLRTMQVSALFRAVFPAAQHGRLKFLLSTQQVSTSATSQLLDCPNTLAKDPATGLGYIHGLAVSAYFDPTVTTGTAAAVLTSFGGAKLDAEITQLKGHAALVAAKGLALTVYEAGPSGTGAGSTNPVISAHQLPGMQDFMTTAYTRLRDEVMLLLASILRRDIWYSCFGCAEKS